MDNSVHILVVDDDERICNLLSRYLSREGYKINTVNSGAEMRRHMEKETPDLVILDLILPDTDGLDLARELRNIPELGIIILTGKGDTVEKIIGLETGADDYIAKPFDNRELLARVRSVLRRSKSNQSNSQVEIKSGHIALFADWIFDLTAYELTSPSGEPVTLTSYEYKLLSALVLSNNRVLKRDHLMDLIAEREWNPDDRSIDVLVGKLRKKLETNPGDPTLIKTIRSTGYKFTAQVTFKKDI